MTITILPEWYWHDGGLGITWIYFERQFSLVFHLLFLTLELRFEVFKW
jgi:hypothetical protein